MAVDAMNIGDERMAYGHSLSYEGRIEPADYIETRLIAETDRLRETYDLLSQVFGKETPISGDRISNEFGPVTLPHLRSGKRWTYDVIRRIASSQPVDVEVTLPIIVPPDNPEDAASQPRWHSTPGPYFAAAALLRTISPLPENVRTILYIQDDLRSDMNDDQITAANRILHTELAEHNLRGDDTLLLRGSTYAPRLPEALDLLAIEGAGNLYRPLDKAPTIYYPSNRTAQQVDLRWPSHQARLDEQGIVFQYRNMRQVVGDRFAAAVLSDAYRPDSMRLRIDNYAYARARQEEYALLLDMGRVLLKNCQAINVMDFAGYMSAYKLGMSLLQDVREYRDSLQRYSSFWCMNQFSYSDKNYATLIPQDQLLIKSEVSCGRQLIDGMLGINRDDPATLLKDGEMIHVAFGSNWNTVLLSHIYTNGYMEVTDVSPSAEAYTRAFQHEGQHLERWQASYNYILASDESGLYQEALRVARDAERVRFKQQGIADLKPGQYRYVGMAFGAEAFLDSPEMFYDALAAISKSLKPGGSVFNGYFTLRYKDGWDDGSGNHFPGLRLELQDIVAALLAAGLDVPYAKTIDDDLPPKDRLREDESMAHIIACRPHAA